VRTEAAATVTNHATALAAVLEDLHAQLLAHLDSYHTQLQEVLAMAARLTATLAEMSRFRQQVADEWEAFVRDVLARDRALISDVTVRARVGRFDEVRADLGRLAWLRPPCDPTTVAGRLVAAANQLADGLRPPKPSSPNPPSESSNEPPP
jgi:hypothetical protein